MDVLVNHANPKSRIVRGATPSGREVEVRVSVVSDLTHPERFMPATINWSSSGAMTPDDADALADAIKFAANVARGLDRENKVKK